MSLDAAIVFAGIFPPDADTGRLFKHHFDHSYFAFIILPLSPHICLRVLFARVISIGWRSHPIGWRLIQSGAFDGALDVQLYSRKLTGLSCSSAQSAAA
jgi:hypothetical protein